METIHQIVLVYTKHHKTEVYSFGKSIGGRKLLVTSASLLVTSALLVVTRS